MGSINEHLFELCALSRPVAVTRSPVHAPRNVAAAAVVNLVGNPVNAVCPDQFGDCICLGAAAISRSLADLCDVQPQKVRVGGPNTVGPAGGDVGVFESARQCATGDEMAVENYCSCCEEVALFCRRRGQPPLAHVQRHK